MKNLNLYYKIAISSGVVQRALKVTLVVGIILNLINQGEVLIHLDFTNLNFIKFFLTFLVPYSVTTYTAVALKLEFQIGTKATVDANLVCKGCGERIYVKENEVIPESHRCGVNTHWKLV